ncbi:hypothetical protein [Flavobacterium phage FL-1]|nr:hypothetical protein [Flavobacterium phage FL-1]
MNKKEVITKDIAISEIETLINRFVKKPVSTEEIEETYPDIVDAIMDGFLSFNDEGIPVLKLKFPIKTESGDLFLSEINFKTRIKPTTLASIAKGIDLKTDQFSLQLKMISHIIDQSVPMLDKFERYDYDVISQVCTIFS